MQMKPANKPLTMKHKLLILLMKMAKTKPTHQLTTMLPRKMIKHQIKIQTLIRQLNLLAQMMLQTIQTTRPLKTNPKRPSLA